MRSDPDNETSIILTASNRCSDWKTKSIQMTEYLQADTFVLKRSWVHFVCTN